MSYLFTAKAMQRVIELISECKLDLAWLELKKSEAQMRDHDKIQVVFRISRICFENAKSPEKIQAEPLFMIFKRFAANVQSIVVPPNFENYLRSIYHIGKFLLEMQNYEGFLETKDTLFPPFMPSELTEGQSAIFSAAASNVFRALIPVQSALKEKKTIVLMLIELIMRILSLVNCTRAFSLHQLPFTLSQAVMDYKATEEVFAFYSKYLENARGQKAPFIYLSVLQYTAIVFDVLVMAKKTAAAARLLENLPGKLNAIKPAMKNHTKLLSICNWTTSQWNSTEAQSLLLKWKRAKVATECPDLVTFLWHTVITSNNYCEREDTAQWISLPRDEHIKYFNFLRTLADLFKQTPYKCKCATCENQVDVKAAYELFKTAVQLIVLLVKHDSIKDDALNQIANNIIEDWINVVRTLKDQECNRWKEAWRCLGGSLINLGQACQKMNDSHSALTCFTALAKYSFELEALHITIMSKTYITYSLQASAAIYVERKHLEPVLSLAALGLLLVNEVDSKMSTCWIAAKYDAQDHHNADKLWTTTTVNALEVNNFVNDYLKDFKLSKQQKIDLLKTELRIYKKNYRKKVAIMAAFKQLAELDEPENVGRFFVEILEDGSMLLHEQVPVIMAKVVTKLEQRNVKDLTMAHLYFLLHRCITQTKALETCKEIERILSFTTCEDATMELGSTCDIVTSYGNLTLENYLQMIRHLKKSFEMVSSLVNANQTAAESFSLLRNIALEYHLHTFTSQGLDAYKLALQVASSDVQRLEIITYICELENNSALIEQGDVVAAQFQREHIHEEEQISFHICKSVALFYQDHERAYQAYTIASNLIEQLPSPGHINKMRFTCLNFQFLMLAREFIDGKTFLELGTLMKAHADFIDVHWQTTRISCLQSRIFLDVNVAMIKFFHVVADSNEVRYFGKEVAIIAQKMLLPFRAIDILFYLGFADFVSDRMDDFRVKLKGILDIVDASCLANLCSDAKTTKPSLEEEIAKLEQKLGKIRLEDQKREDLQRSPTVLKENTDNLKLTQIYSHRKGCDCLPCTNHSYHNAVLISIYFNSLVSLSEDQMKQAQRYLLDGMTFYELYKKPELKYSYALIVYEYCSLLLRAGKLKHAAKINDSLLGLLNSNRLECGQFRNRVIVQNCVILLMGQEQQKKENLNDAFCEFMDEDVVQTKSKVQITVTPESKQNPVTIKIFESPTTPQFPKRRIKPPKFELSDEETENKPNKPNTRCASSTKMEIPTPINPAVERQLRSRSKLLTDKLKKANKPPELLLTDENNVRRNLRFDLEKDDKPPKTRSSSRAKKGAR